jgi:hypothetical protein
MPKALPRLLIHQRKIFSGIAAVFILGLLMLQLVQADTIYVVDASAEQVTMSDTVFVGGNPAFVYWEADSQQIKLALCANPACETGTTTIRTLDTRPNVTAVAIAEVNGSPFVAYADSTSRELNVIACTNLACDPMPTPRPMSTGIYIDHLHVFNRNGQPMLVFARHLTARILLPIILACTDSTCSVAQEIQGVIPSLNIVSTRAFNAVAANDKVVVTYFYVNELFMMVCDGTTCGFPRRVHGQSLFPSTSVSIALSNNDVVLVFPVGSLAYLNFWVCVGEYCAASASWRPSDIGGVPSNFAVQNVGGALKLAYVKDGSLRLATCSNNFCVSMTEIVIATSDVDIKVVDLTDVNGSAGITYLAGNGSLRFYYEGSYTPVETATPSPPPTVTAVPPFDDLLPTSVPAAAPIHLFFVTGHPTLTWNRISWAAAYDVEISESDTFAELVDERYGIAPSQLAYTPDSELSSGTYFYRVRGVRADGTTGQWSGGMFIVLVP